MDETRLTVGAAGKLAGLLNPALKDCGARLAGSIRHANDAGHRPSLAHRGLLTRDLGVPA